MNKPKQVADRNIAFRLPDPASPELVVLLSPWRSPCLKVGDLDVHQAPGKRRTFVVPMADGRQETIQLRSSAGGGVSLVFRGSKITLRPGLNGWRLILAMLPIGLVGVGGALGGMVGALGMMVNFDIMRRSMRSGLQVLATLAVTAAAAILYVACAALFSLAVR